MTPEQSWDVIRVFLFLVYFFGLVPLVGYMFGGNYCSFGNNDAYENCMCRGLIVHAVLGIIYLITTSVINVI